MDKLQAVQFDVRGTRVENRVIREKIPIKDKACPWIVPNGTPYFAENTLVTLYNQAGGALVAGTDYTFDGKFLPFCEITGRNICSFVQLSDKVLAENEFVSMTYQSIGAWFVPRNSIDEWVDLINAAGGPIPWERVFNVPATLPAEYHSHSIKTEIGDWYELTFFFNYIANYYSTRDPNVQTGADEVIADSFNQLKAVKAAQLARLNNHDKNYGNAHQITKAHLDLGNLDNFRTATLEEDLAGTASNLFSTPAGVLALSAEYARDSDLIMRNGVLPISYFGGGSYIPPQISGSFEGMGTKSEACGMCLENTGELMMLQNHYDGRVNGLYFSVIDGYRGPTPKVTYTGYRYAPPSLENKGVQANRIVPGSGSKAIMVGVDGTNDWYLALTNGTFNPTTHQFVKCSVAAINTFLASAIYINSSSGTLFETDDYVFLMQPGGSNSNGERFAFFRISKEDIRKGLDVTWTLLKVTYPDYDGVVQSAQNYLTPFVYTRNASNEITRAGPWTFRQPAAIGRRSGKPQVWSYPLKDNPGMVILQIMHYNYFTRDGIDINLIADTGFNFNPETGVMTLRNKTTPIEVGFSDTTQAQRTAYLYDYYQPFRYIGGLGTVNAYFLEDGTLFTPYPNNSNQFPVYIQRSIFKDYNNLESIISKPLEVPSIGGLDGMSVIANIVRGPLLSGGYTASVSYDTDGEMYTANDPVTNTRKTFFRKVTGQYQARAGITNLDLPSLKSRPLSNDVYNTNVRPLDGVVNITGSAAHLATAGVEQGSSAFSMGGWTSSHPTINFPISATLKAPTGNNVVGSFPRTSSKTLNPSTRMADYKGDTFFGYRQAFIDLVKGLIPLDYRWTTPSWSFMIQVLNERCGGMFFGLDLCVLTIFYYDQVNKNTRTQLVLCRLTVEAPGGDHPTLHLITGLTVLHQPADVMGYKNTVATGGVFTYNEGLRGKPMLSCYREDNRLKCHGISLFAISPALVSRIRTWTFFDINLDTLRIENIGQAGFNWNVTDPITHIPRVGPTDLNVAYNDREAVLTALPVPQAFDYSGGAAAIYKRGADYYLLASIYPETGWVIFFQEGIKLMIQGTTYQTVGGSVDLRDIDPDPRNKTFYIYATIEGTRPKYILSTVELRRGNAMLLVGSVTTGVSQILSIERHQPFVVGDYEMSYTRKGGIIPVSSGLPQDDGTFKFLKNSELLP